MKSKLRILFLSSEVSPFAKTGGLADVSRSLPKALFEMGHDVRVMMPKYGPISERKYILREVIRLKKIPIKVGKKGHITNAKSAFIPESKVQVYFLDYKPFFGRPELYVDPKTGKDYADNAERFMLFSKAVLETIKLLHWQPDVIHCNDWQTGMIPWLLKHDYADDEFFQNTKTLFTVHNLAYQGSFDKSIAGKIGLPLNTDDDSEFVIYDRINFLKTGLVCADGITTVSPTYAKEIQSDEELSAGLGEVLQERKKDIFGILNGADYSIWNPETDDLIPAKYSANDLASKIENKKALAKAANLPFDEKIPIVGIVSRLVDQKGFDLIAEIIDKLPALKCQMVILGLGEEKYHKLLTKASKKLSKNLSALLMFDEKMAHLIEAGADIFLMPSRFEPCGLNQMYSLKYGTVPVVRRTGGLADTIIDFVQDPDKGNGFVFDNYESRDMLNSLQNAIKAFQDQKTWKKLQKRGMRANFSWNAAAENYVKVYQKLETRK